MASGEIFHNGIILSVDESRAKVKILDASKESCSCCAAASFCGGQAAVVDVVLSPAQASTAAKGDKVTLRTRTGMKMTATTRLLVLPLVVFILALVLALECGATELWASLIAMAAVAAVYAAVHFFARGKGPAWSVVEIKQN